MNKNELIQHQRPIRKDTTIMATTRRGNIGVTVKGVGKNLPELEYAIQPESEYAIEAEKLGDEMVEALTKFEEEQTDMTLAEAVHLVLEPAEFFIKEAKEGTIAKSPRFRRAVSYLRNFVEN